MKGRLACLFPGLVLLFSAQPAWAFITDKWPLKDHLATEQYIFIAKVASLHPEKPGIVLTVAEDLKGKIPCRRLPINMKGDRQGEEKKHTPQLFKRLAVDLPVLVFSSKQDKLYVAFIYTNGTWFQVLGHVEKDPDRARWSLVHGEPYLRRTFKGTTAELRQIVLDGLEKKKEPPDYDPKVEPGFGPEVESPPKKGAREGMRFQSPFVRRGGSPPLAVIPTVFVMGPLALLATLFPAVFGGFQRRWVVLLSIVSLNSTLFVAYFLVRGYIQEYWWSSLLVLWGVMAVISLAGLLWSWKRYQAALKAGAVDTFLPRSGEEKALLFLSLAGICSVCYALGKGVLLGPNWKEMFALWSVVWVGTLYALYLRVARGKGAAFRPALPLEGIMLGTLAIACAAVGASHLPQPSTAVEVADPNLPKSTGASDDTAVDVSVLPRPAPRPQGVAWTFEAKARGTIDSTPLVDGNRIYVGAKHQISFRTYGTLYCLDRATGKEIWSFNNDGLMKPIFSTPCVAAGRLYVGEGYHEDSYCNLYCLKEATGEKLWEFETGSHTESSPCVAGGKVFFGAGDDGIYCIDAVTGKKIWQHAGVHVDNKLAVAGKRLYGGSGYGTFEVFCLNADTGKREWTLPLENLRSFAAPTVSGNRVFFGIGTGNLTESLLTGDDKPAGALLCVEAATGRRIWRFDVSDGVHVQPVVDGRYVYFGSRNQRIYCVTSKDGRRVWEQDLGSPALATPALALCSCCGSSRSLFAAASGGRVFCLDADSGAIAWSFDVAKHSKTQPQLFSSPVVVVDRENTGERRSIYVGAGLNNVVTWTAMLYCLEDRVEVK